MHVEYSPDTSLFLLITQTSFKQYVRRVFKQKQKWWRKLDYDIMVIEEWSTDYNTATPDSYNINV